MLTRHGVPVPGWVPQPLTPNQQADADLVANLREREAPSWALGEPASAALRDEANRLHHLSHGRSAEASAIRAEIGRLMETATPGGARPPIAQTGLGAQTPRDAGDVVTTRPMAGRVPDLPSSHRPGPVVAPSARSLGHEPPIIWVARHSDYDGPLVLRPEHLACNISKHGRPDWESVDVEPEDE